MKLVVCLLTLLVVTSTAQRIKGGPRIIQDPSGLQGIGGGPHVHVGKGGVGGALHHTAVVQDPLTGSPVVVEKVSRVGSGGIKSAGLGAGSGQFALADGPFGQRRIYRVGQSQIPYGLLGSDYYSYPSSLLTAPRGLRRKTVLADNLSGLRPVGFGGRTIIADPSAGQFSIGDAQIKTSAFGARRPLYRSGISSIPYGLSGSDYYSYPRQLLTQRQLADGLGLGQAHILTGGSPFTAGDSQIRGPLIDNVGQQEVTIVETDPHSGGQRVTTVQKAASPFGTIALGGSAVKTTQQVVPQQVAVVDDGFGRRQVIRTSGGGLGGLRGGQIVLSGGRGLGGLRTIKSRPAVATIGSSGLGAPFGGFGQRQVITKSAPVAPVRVVQAAAPIRVVQQAAPVRVVQAPAPVRILQAPAPVRVVQAPAPVQIVQAAPAPFQVLQAPVQRRIITRRPGEVFLSQIAARPRVATYARPAQISVPVASQRVAGLGNMQFTLGGNQLYGGQIVAHSPVISAAPRAVLAAPAPIIAAAGPQVISQVKTDVGLRNSLFGNRVPQLIYVDGGHRFPGFDLIGGSRIGDPRLGYTQLPISTSRFANLGLSQASIEAGPTLLAPANPVLGLRKGGSLLSPLGKTSPTKVVTQEEVIGPHGDPQVITTITETDSNSIVPSKIGGLSHGGALGLAGIGRASPSKVVTQEEVVGPLGDRQVVTTVTETDSNRLVGSKMGGAAVGGPLGLAGIGRSGLGQVVTQEEVVGPAGDPQIITTVHQAGPVGPSKIGGSVVAGPLGMAGIGAPRKTITQEEVIGPAGDSHIVTTVTKSDPSSKIGGLASGGLSGIGGPTTIVHQEDPITGLRTTSKISRVAQDPIETAIQESLGDTGFGSVQSLLDPHGGGQAHLSVDDLLSGGLGGGLAQQNLADAIVQESISSGLGRSGYGYRPRVSFLSNYPYDAPDSGLLRSVITRPVVQQQQVEQILV